MKRSFIEMVLIAILTTVIIVALVGPASAKVVCKIAKIAGDEGSMENWVLQRYKQVVEDRSDGEIEIQPIFGAALGSTVQVIESLRLGTIQGNYNVSGDFSTWVPQSDVLNLPFLIRNADHAFRVTSGPISKKFASYFLPHGFRVVAMWNNGFRTPMGHYAMNKVEDAAGKKVRIKPDRVAVAFWKALGASPTPLSWSELASAMQTHTVDMFDATGNAYWDLKLYEIAPYYSELNYAYISFVVAFSETWWKKQSTAHQRIMEDAAQELALFQHHLAEYWSAKGPILASRVGGKVNIVKDKGPWIAKSKSVIDDWASRVEGGRELIDAIRAVK